MPLRIIWITCWAGADKSLVCERERSSSLCMFSTELYSSIGTQCQWPGKGKENDGLEYRGETSQHVRGWAAWNGANIRWIKEKIFGQIYQFLPERQGETTVSVTFNLGLSNWRENVYQRRSHLPPETWISSERMRSSFISFEMYLWFCVWTRAKGNFFMCMRTSTSIPYRLYLLFCGLYWSNRHGHPLSPPWQRSRLRRAVEKRLREAAKQTCTPWQTAQGERGLLYFSRLVRDLLYVLGW